MHHSHLREMNPHEGTGKSLVEIGVSNPNNVSRGIGPLIEGEEILELKKTHNIMGQSASWKMDRTNLTGHL